MNNSEKQKTKKIIELYYQLSLRDLNEVQQFEKQLSIQEQLIETQKNKIISRDKIEKIKTGVFHFGDLKDVDTFMTIEIVKNKNGFNCKLYPFKGGKEENYSFKDLATLQAFFSKDKNINFYSKDLSLCYLEHLNITKKNILKKANKIKETILGRFLYNFTLNLPEKSNLEGESVLEKVLYYLEIEKDAYPIIGYLYSNLFIDKTKPTVEMNENLEKLLSKLRLDFVDFIEQIEIEKDQKPILDKERILLLLFTSLCAIYLILSILK